MDVLNCRICKKSFTGEAPFKQHIVSEKHKKKVQSFQMSESQYPVQEGKARSDILQPITCEVCSLNFSELGNFQKHVNSLEHAISVQSMSTNSFPAQNMANLKAKGEDTLQSSMKPYAECTVCRKEFSGPEPYKQHIESNGHLKNVARLSKFQDHLESTEVDSDEKGNSIPNFEAASLLNIPKAEIQQYAECKICSKVFTGIESYQQHLNSKGHKKNLGIESTDSYRSSQILMKVTYPIVECLPCQIKFYSMDVYNSHIESDNHKINIDGQNSLSINVVKVCSKNLKCDVCDLVCSGPIPYSDHLESKAHNKKVYVAKLFKGVELNTSSSSSEADSTVNTSSLSETDSVANTSSSEADSMVTDSIERKQKIVECLLCQTKFYAMDEYHSHVESDSHKTNIKAWNFTALNSETGCLNNYTCDVCDLVCSGPIPFSDHLKSKTHNKKILAAKLFTGLELNTSLLSSEADSVLNTSFPNADSTVTDGMEGRPPIFSTKWYCDVCHKQCNGPIPYQTHILSQDHEKNRICAEINAKLQKCSGLSTLDYSNYSPLSLNSKLSYNSHVSDSDLLIPDPISLESLNIHTFGPDDPIIFDCFKKENKK